MTTINIRIDESTKKKFVKICEDIGLDVSSVVKLFIMQVIYEQRIPFEIKTSKYKQK